jgi:hypothetical protein
MELYFLGLLLGFLIGCATGAFVTYMNLNK